MKYDINEYVCGIILAKTEVLDEPIKLTASNLPTSISLAPQSKPNEKTPEKNNDKVRIPSSKKTPQDQGKILNYIKQQRLKRKVQLKQEKNEKLSMEQARKQRLKELQV